ncbi:MAG: hypothetical protein K2N03_04660 [Muribaculaceae bacterium]|nr:hypothetical protein [Muribaculaceae bacterium]
MKKLLSTSLIALSCLAASAQYQDVSPTPGPIDLSINESGLMSINFKLDGAWQANRSQNLFANLYFNDEIISKVPVSNAQLVKYDGVMNDDWTVSFYRSLSPKVKQIGAYRVVFEEGLFINTETGELSEELTLNYTISRTHEISIIPTPGITTSLFDIEVIFSDYKSIEVNPEQENPIEIFNIYGEETASGEREFYVPISDIDGNHLYLYLSEEITSPGAWTLSIPEDYFLLTKEDGTVVKSPGISEVYRIPNIIGGILPTPDPKPGIISYFPGEIILQLPAGQQVINVNTQGGNFIYPVDSEGNYGESVARYHASLDKWDDTIVILTNLAKKDGKGVDLKLGAGNYVLVTTESLYAVKGYKSWQSPMTFEYTIEGSQDEIVITPDPNETHESIQEISFTFPNATDVALGDGSAAWFTSSLSCYMFYPKSVDKETKTITYSTGVAATVPGDYTFQIPSTALAIDGEYISLMPVFTIGEESSVNEIVLPERFTIYSIDGRMVKANATSLDGIEKGLYIVDGRKVLVK